MDRAFTVDQDLGQLFIMNLNTGSVIKLDGLFPNDLSENQTANFEGVSIKGRSSEFAIYSGGTSRTVNLSFELHEDYLGGYLGIYDIRQMVSLLKATAFPIYESSGAIIPPRIYLRVADTIIINKGYSSGCNVTWKKPIRDGRYIMADVTMDITEISKRGLDTYDVANMAQYR